MLHTRRIYDAYTTHLRDIPSEPSTENDPVYSQITTPRSANLHSITNPINMSPPPMTRMADYIVTTPLLCPYLSVPKRRNIGLITA